MAERLQSTKLIFGCLLVCGATLAMMLGKMEIAQWTEYTTYIFGLYAGSNALATIGGGLAQVVGKKNGKGGE